MLFIAFGIPDSSTETEGLFSSVYVSRNLFKIPNMKTIPKPLPEEYPEYAETYLQWMPNDGQLLLHLKNNFRKVNSQ